MPGAVVSPEGTPPPQKKKKLEAHTLHHNIWTEESYKECAIVFEFSELFLLKEA